MKRDKPVSTKPSFDVVIPDSQLAREVTQLIRDTESELLFNHSTRVYLWGALLGKRKNLEFDPELLYVAAMFHDIGLTENFRKASCASKWMAQTSRGTFCAANISARRT